MLRYVQYPCSLLLLQIVSRSWKMALDLRDMRLPRGSIFLPLFGFDQLHNFRGTQESCLLALLVLEERQHGNAETVSFPSLGCECCWVGFEEQGRLQGPASLQPCRESPSILFRWQVLMLDGWTFLIHLQE